jgi:hypothetical protein
MINIGFSIRNPWRVCTVHWRSSLFYKHGNTPFKNKHWELQIDKEPRTLISFEVSLTHRSDHAGLLVALGLLGYWFSFSFYDSRHWDYEKGSYETSVH